MMLSLQDLRAGDLMIGPIGGAAGVAAALGQIIIGEGTRIGELSARHVGIVTAPGWLAQAMPGGAEEIPMTLETHWTKRHAYIRLPEDYIGQGKDAARVASLMVEEGVGYSFGSYPALAAWKAGLPVPHLERWIDRRRPPVPVQLPHAQFPGGLRFPVEAICSVFADQAWSLVGKRVAEGVARQCVTPGLLAGQLLQRPGVRWCRPFGPEGGASCWQVQL